MNSNTIFLIINFMTLLISLSVIWRVQKHQREQDKWFEAEFWLHSLKTTIIERIYLEKNLDLNKNHEFDFMGKKIKIINRKVFGINEGGEMKELFEIKENLLND